MKPDTLLHGTPKSLTASSTVHAYSLHVPKYHKLDFDKIQELATLDEKLNILLQLYELFNFSIDECKITKEMSKYTKII